MIERFEIESDFNLIRGIVAYPKEVKKVHPCVILSHGLLSSKDSPKYIQIAHRLTDEGIIAVRFDYMGCGESGGRLEETTLTKRLDNLKKVFEFILSKASVDKEKVGILGSSFGGSTAIVMAAKDKRVKALVILATPYALPGPSNEISSYFKDSLYSDFTSYDILEAAGSVSHCLVIHGEEDEVVPVFHGKAIYERLREPKRIVIISGADHTFSEEEKRNIAVEMAISWFKKYLL
jgi:dienelactone hydrolase